MPSLDPGIHLLHKPAGPTSFSLVQPFLSEARGLRPRIAVCHGGALDPFAEGLLPILVGRGDASGLDPARLDGALAPFLGWHEQVPPATSNKRVGGERAYVRAHRGELVELPPVRVYVHEARWVWHDLAGASWSAARRSCPGALSERSTRRKPAPCAAGRSPGARCARPTGRCRRGFPIRGRPCARCSTGNSSRYCASATGCCGGRSICAGCDRSRAAPHRQAIELRKCSQV